MIARLFRRPHSWAAAGRPGPDVVPAGAVVWAVGDVHGRLDLLAPLLDLILDDLASSGASRRVLVMLGDYVDRGAESRGVLERLAQVRADPTVESHLLCGNHDAVMRAFLDDPEMGPRWSALGGGKTLASYGVAVPARTDGPDIWAAASAALADAMPDAQRALLAALKPSAEVGDYFFCHAGARPGVALEAQSDRDLMWIRREFLDDGRPFERMVVHGHTPAESLHADHRRIGLDTGAHVSGVLTGLRLAGATRVLVQTGPGAGGVRLSARPLGGPPGP